MRVLIVEDDIDEQNSWKRQFDMHNADTQDTGHGFFIEAQFASTLTNVRKCIATSNFDAAIVDIRLQLENGNAAPNTDGNDALKEILEAEMAAVAAFTGETKLVDSPEYARGSVRIFVKGGDDGDGTNAVMRWLTEQAPMLEHIQAAQEAIRREMAKIFAKSIWPRWANWIVDQPSQNQVQSAITRHITSHVYATLQERGNQVAHPEEWYFVPPIRDGLRTGDLLQFAAGLEIVITPRCDLARPATRGDTIQLAVCEDVSAEWQALVDAVNAAKGAYEAAAAAEGTDTKKPLEKLGAAEEKLRKFTQHRSKTNLHFLPQMKLADRSLGPFMVRFDKVRFVERPVNENIQFPGVRVAALTGEFLPSLVERLGTFFSRIGTPDYSHPN
ncbi:hypothetical protein PI93_004605 [Pandoraea fibrosis]|uniref:Response regulatory domain-containing protein n=1 Tax=Pandoraea fibrosis TaxID=1891094 RepID=A0ABX6HN94_9BURK|nr:hypothetical protein [Pandoraea fibrosis]QHE91178.1 hypothetical protein PJ20_004605 [Pandoraea fibrosis]QHF12009.1 hypothetical protein PI93_004605 [Pandoraea fibrosis]